ncbi:MAG: NADPH-dependent F420 reductase [Chloroflexota bacterium]
MKIGILGAGRVGNNLGRGWGSIGHQIVFGVRDPGKPELQRVLTELGGRANATTIRNAAEAAEVIVLALPWSAVETTLPDLGDALAGKVVIDATNRLTQAPANTSGSAGQDVQRLAPRARVVKAFNTIGAEQYLQPSFDGLAASMFICGDDPQAKQVVADLSAELGFDVVDCGTLENAPLLENLTRLWIFLAYNGEAGRDIAFKLLRRGEA